MAMEGAQLKVCVRDEGPGLPKSEQQRIWERYHRAPDVERKTGSDVGLGLGLFISKTIISQHGGQVGVVSEVGHGAAFYFTLPRPPRPCPAATPHTPKPLPDALSRTVSQGDLPGELAPQQFLIELAHTGLGNRVSMMIRSGSHHLATSLSCR